MIAKQPLALTNNLEAFDMQVNVNGGGESGQAGATRHGITRAADRLRRLAQARAEPAGFVTRDAREVERKKVGLRGAPPRKAVLKR